MNKYFNGSGTIGFTCDNCGRETHGCTWVNGMSFCAKCYQETFGETDKDKQIANLEAKLAEAKKEISEYIVVVDDLHKQLSNKCDFCEEQYKQQLAEKETRIAELEEENDQLQDKLHSYYEEVMNKGTCGLCEHLRGEYKTDFAIEQLERTLDIVENGLDDALKNSSLNSSYYDKILDKLDQQINKLKEGK